jgi:transaldolase
LYPDTAAHDEIAARVECGAVDGVTTNPTLIAKAGQDPPNEATHVSKKLQWVPFGTRMIRGKQRTRAPVAPVTSPM